MVARYRPGLPRRVLGDGGRVRQVLLNLAGNAVKFTQRGYVLIDAAVEQAEGEHPRVRISVRDTGVGVPRDRLDRIFGPFEQIETSTTRRTGGTGLGVPICERLVALMGGEIGVTSKPGAGIDRGAMIGMLPPHAREDARESSVGARLVKPVCPLQLMNAIASALQHQRVPEPDDAPADRRRWRLLVVEDSAVSRMLALQMLGRAGFTVEGVASGVEALAAVAAKRYDAILMDCVMPEMDGYETTRRLRLIEGGRDVPVIAMTANAMPGDRERCLAAGMDDYLPKPVPRQLLIETVDRWVDREAATTAGDEGRKLRMDRRAG